MESSPPPRTTKFSREEEPNELLTTSEGRARGSWLHGISKEKGGGGRNRNKFQILPITLYRFDCRALGHAQHYDQQIRRSLTRATASYPSIAQRSCGELDLRAS